jgi:hypothetical protein
MKVFIYCLAAALLGASLAWGQLREAPPGQPVSEGIEVLTRGPVHEAFAETISFDPEPGVLVPKAAPDPIEELPPDQKPDGANVDWIPGYWAWDDERTDYLWVSGVWRALPPGRQWVSGYWANLDRGAQWTSGYWADAQTEEIEYLPEPPATVEEGPNIAAPSADHQWIPGSWIWQQNRYGWRPGFWNLTQPNWVWTPARYVWARRGYVYVDGYYDHSVERRGVMFAPVYVSASTYSRPGFSYSPAMVINPNVFSSHLFLRPSYGHYYFGDYYGSNYASIGFSPWFSFASHRSVYDPFYAHQRWHHRSDRQWSNRLESDFARRRDREEARPPRTWTDQRERPTRDPAIADDNLVLAAPLEEVVASKKNSRPFKPLAQEERKQFSQRGQEFRTAREARQQLEDMTAGDATERPERAEGPVRARLPRTPIASQPVDRLGEEDAPPKAAEAPPLDAKVEPKPRRPRNTSESPDRPVVTPRETPPRRPQTKSEDSPAEPRPERPTTEPRPERPTAEPKAAPEAAPKAAPKATPKKARKATPKSTPKAKAAPRPERPATEAKPRPPREPAQPSTAQPSPTQPSLTQPSGGASPRSQEEPKGKSGGKGKQKP